MKFSVLASGSKGNATFIETNETKVLIDLGMSSLYIEKKLFCLGINPSEINAIFITHTHVDHIAGLKVFLKKYKTKVFKVSLNLDLTCPNKDGTKGYGGCIYCKNGSGDFAGNKNDNLKEQFTNIKNILHKKWPNAKYIAYFQANTNTYGDINYLKEKYEETLTYENVLGINIATRCDAINEQCLNYFVNVKLFCRFLVKINVGFW